MQTIASLRWALAVALILPASGALAANAPAEQTKFDLLEIQVEGNTVLPVRTVERVVYPHLGESKSVSDVEAARVDLEQAYHDAGYPTVFVDIPEQRVTGGVVILSVTESKVSRVRVVGSHYFSQGWILAHVPSLKEGETLNVNSLRAELAQVNRTSDRRVTPVLRAGAERGTTEVDLQVEDRLPLHGSLEFSNRYSPHTEPFRLTAGLRYDNLFQRDHAFALQYQTTPGEPSQVKAFVATYLVPLVTQNASVSAYYLQSESNVAALGGFSVAGNAKMGGLRFNQTLPATATFSQSLSAGIDYKDVQESLNPNDPLSSSVTTPVRYAPFLVQYSGAMLRQSSTTEFVTGLNFAIRGFASSDQQFENKRFNALTNYVILRWDLQHTQTLPANFVLYGRFDGQIADQPLVSNEQYFAGGLLNVPGYLEAEELGDNAYHALAELRTPSWLVLPLPAKQELRGYVYVFYAGAWLQTVQPLPSQTADSTLSSAGLGLRLNAGTWANLVLSAGWPFEATANTRAHSPRVQFIVAIQM